MEVMTRNMTQLVRIAGDVDCNDLVVLELQRGGLQRIALLDGDEPWQAIDEAVAHEPRHVLGKDRRQCGMDPHAIHARHRAGKDAPRSRHACGQRPCACEGTQRNR